MGRRTRERKGRLVTEEAVAEAAMASTVRVLDASGALLAQIQRAAERVNEELSLGWFGGE